MSWTQGMCHNQVRTEYGGGGAIVARDSDKVCLEIQFSEHISDLEWQDNRRAVSSRVSAP
jgi:hypothetical protein